MSGLKCTDNKEENRITAYGKEYQNTFADIKA